MYDAIAVNIAMDCNMLLQYSTRVHVCVHVYIQDMCTGIQRLHQHDSRDDMGMGPSTTQYQLE